MLTHFVHILDKNLITISVQKIQANNILQCLTLLVNYANSNTKLANLINKHHHFVILNSTTSLISEMLLPANAKIVIDAENFCLLAMHCKLSKRQATALYWRYADNTLTNKQIGDKMDIAEVSVKEHLKRSLNKLNVSSVSQAIDLILKTNIE